MEDSSSGPAFLVNVQTVTTDFLPWQWPQLPRLPQEPRVQEVPGRLSERRMPPPVSSMGHEMPQPTAECIWLLRGQELVLPLEPKYRCAGVRGQG